jgi:hypothetical protein
VIVWLNAFFLGAIFGLLIGLYFLRRQEHRSEELLRAYHKALDQFMQDELDRTARFQEFVVPDKDEA